MRKSVDLYRTDWWLTDASIGDDGDLTIMSGDKDNEWSKIIPADSKPALLDALLRHVSIDEPLEGGADERLLRALSAMFAGEHAHENIKVFLERNAVPARDFNWLWGNDD
jgi:hypothetical protein